MNETYVKIVGGLVTVEEIRIIRSGKLTDLLTELGKNTTTLTGILPVGCRALGRNADGDTFVVEQTPQVRTLTFCGPASISGLPEPTTPRPALRAGMTAQEQRETNIALAMWNGTNHPKPAQYRVALPYCIFTFEIHKNGAMGTVSLNYRKAPLAADDIALFDCNLPNVHDSRICIGDAARIPTSLPVSVRIARYIESFWSSQFNVDLTDQFREAAAAIPSVATFTAWAAATAENPLFVLNVPWPQAYSRHCRLAGVEESAANVRNPTPATDAENEAEL